MLRRLRWGESWELGEPPGALPGGCGSVTPPSRLLQSPGPGPSGLWALSVKLHLPPRPTQTLCGSAGWCGRAVCIGAPGRDASGPQATWRPGVASPPAAGPACPSLPAAGDTNVPRSSALIQSWERRVWPRPGGCRAQGTNSRGWTLGAGRSSLPHWLGPCAPPSPRRVGPLPTRSGPVTREDPPSLLRGSWLTHHDRWENKAKL